MKAPVRLSQARNRIGLFEADVFLPDVGSVGLSFPQVLVLGLITRGCSMDPRSLFCALAARGRLVGQTTPSVRDLKNGARPSLARETGGTGNEDRRIHDEPEANTQRQRHRGAKLGKRLKMENAANAVGVAVSP